jgi:hypothetical protein
VHKNFVFQKSIAGKNSILLEKRRSEERELKTRGKIAGDEVALL